MVGDNPVFSQHIPVLPAEVLEYMAPKAGGTYLDGTVGLGGHSAIILEAATGSRLLGLDRDVDALAIARERLASFGDRVALRRAKFSDASKILDELGWTLIDGALIDIGVSSLQLDTPERGFSFLRDGPLDMRMDQQGDDFGPGDSPASVLVNKASLETLKEIILTLGEEPQAGRIARAIVEARKNGPICTTKELAAIVDKAYPAKWRATARNHPATRTFQALRATVNDELGQLSAFLKGIVPRIAVGGRLVIISFHSLEDRIVKHFLREESIGCHCPRQVPLCICGHVAALRILTKKPVMASVDESSRNPRATSAKLRAAERIATE